MNLFKPPILALIAVSAVAATTSVEASADTLCEENIAVCPEVKRVKVGAKIAGLAKGTSLLSFSSLSIELKCNSETLGEITRTGGGKPVLGTLTKMLFTGCEGPCKEAHAVNLPYSVEWSAVQGHALFKAAVNRVGMLVKGCPLGLECHYEANISPFLFSVFGDAFIAFEAPLTVQNPGSCLVLPNEVKCDATYLLTLDPQVTEHVTPITLSSSP